ncbi:TonB-dependent receptor [Dyella sp.]|uniref:TonB-dependent receptor n=1 Tax=Dyella sp. TaxID=1869338 RepID=UPI002D798B1A|nr:TonB-dependent receptor [Dyella sp.]HET6433391.1 TonB-dependent receptor [Dyella sp.]
MTAVRPLALALLSVLAAPARAAEAPQTVQLQRVEVSESTVRMPRSQGALPMTITVIDQEDLRQQLAITPDLSQAIGALLPSFSPATQKLSSRGETLRGRNPLYMIDGVPQSSPLRNGSRDAYTIDPAMIERIEIVEGANALQGLGASGGIINIITRRPPTTDGVEQRVTLEASAPTRGSDGLGYAGAYLLGVRQGAFDAVVGVSQRERGMYSDAKGRLIGVDGTQGDLMDSTSKDAFAKLGYDFAGEQHLQLTINHFQLQGHGDYLAVPGDMDAGVPTTSVRGSQPGEAPRNRVLTSSVDYRDPHLAGGELRAQLYYQSNRELFGGGTFGTFQDPAYGATVFDQSQNVSLKRGARLSWARGGLLDERLNVLAGVDGYRDTTHQELIQTGRNWVPDSTYTGWAPFLQAEYWVLPSLSVNGGLRQEHGRLNVPTFRTLAFYNGVTVQGGSTRFTKTLPNLGAVWYLGDHLNLFASYAEGYTLPDVGRVLRAINRPGQSVAEFLDLKPVVSDNREVGADFDNGPFSARVSHYSSTSRLGSVLVFDAANQVYNVARQRIEISGWEARAGWKPLDGTRLAMSYAINHGRSDRNGDGRVDSDLDGANIAPNRLNLSWTQRWDDAWSSMLQVSRLASRDFATLGVASGHFDGYVTADAFVRWHSRDVGEWTLGVQNLANRQYINYVSQTVGDDASYFAGRGRTVSLSWQQTF